MATLSRREKLGKVEEIFAQLSASVLTGSHKVNQDEGTKLGGYLLQIQYGDHDPAVHKPGFLRDLRPFIPHHLTEVKQVEKLLYSEHASAAGMSMPKAKLRYAKICKASPTTFTKGKGKLSLSGYSRDSVIHCDARSVEVMEKHPLMKVAKWQMDGTTFRIDFRDHSAASVWFEGESDVLQLLALQLPAAVQRCRKRMKQGKSRDDEREGAGLSVTTSGGGGGARNPLFGMNLDNMPGTEGFGGFGDAGESTDDVEEPVPGLGGTGGVGNLRTQTGFLSGFNRAAGAHTLGRSSFDLDGGKMAGIAQQNQKTARESHGGFGGLDEVFTPPPGSKEAKMAARQGGQQGGADDAKYAAKGNELNLKIDEAIEDLTASAAILDSVPRLGSRRANPKWCLKTRNEGRKAAQKQLIGVATVCKRLIPKLKAWLSSEDHFGSLNHQPLDLEELMPRAGTFADNTKDLVAKLKVLTVAEQQQEDARLEAKAELERGNATAAAKAEAELQKQEEARVAAAMKEVDRLEKIRVDKLSARQRAEEKVKEDAAKAMRRRAEQAEKAAKKALEEKVKAERKVREEAERAERKAREEAEKAAKKAAEEAEKAAKAEAKRKLAEEARKRREEEAERKRKIKEEKERKIREEKERIAAEKEAKKAKFLGRIAMFE
eukprot:gene8552-13322_t